jgi:hypothetical protein
MSNSYNLSENIVLIKGLLILPSGIYRDIHFVDYSNVLNHITFDNKMCSTVDSDDEIKNVFVQ